MPWAYIALLNSVAFECLLSHFCTRVGGGQYELYRKFTEQIPVPDLTRVDATVVKKMARAGRLLSRGKEISLSALDEMVCGVYGLAIDEFRHAFRVSDSPTIRKVLAELSSAWKKGTAHHSAMSQMKLHPAYGRIVEFGFAAVPFILSRMQKGEGRWFDALETIAGENPVPAARRGNVRAMIDEWLRWGSDRGYLA